MSDNEKSTDPGLSAAERKELRSREAKEAVADHEEAQQAFHANRERLRAERLAREAVAGPMLYPAPELPDDTPIENVRFSTRVRNALTTAGVKTVGEIREASDAMLLSLQDLGKGSVAHLRETLGLPSTDGVRPFGQNATWVAEFSVVSQFEIISLSAIWRLPLAIGWTKRHHKGNIQAHNPSKDSRSHLPFVETAPTKIAGGYVTSKSL
jgi:hypothetical protein